VLRCEGFPTFRDLTAFPSSGCAGGLVVPKYLVSRFGATKPPVNSEDGDGVGTRNVGKSLHLDASVYPTKLH
jgi:hypothetical protein